MADKTNDINSTEKLLDAIRGKQEEAGDDIGKSSISPPQELLTPQGNKKISKFFPDKKKYTIGVDISHNYICLAKVIASPDYGTPILIDQKIINYDEKIDKGSSEFNSLLKASLFSICGNSANCNIWTMMSADEVNIQRIKIPPVQKKQMENTIYWAAKKETSFDEKDSIFDYEVQEDIIEQGIPKHSVMVYTAPLAEIEKTKLLFSNIGISLTGITIAPFAIQNIYRMKWLPVEGTTATLFIGNEFSRISIYSKDNLVMTRRIKTGISSMMEAITDLFLSKKGSLTLGKEDAKKILFSLGSDSEKPNVIYAGFDLNEDGIFAMIVPVIERLTRQIERTLQYYYTISTGQEKVEKIYVSSVIKIYAPVSDYISEQLGIKIELIDPFKYQTGRKIAETISLADKMALVPALGLSFSDNHHTPNLIFTYKEKNNEIITKRINRGIMAVFAAALVACIITIIYQGIDIFALNKQRETLKREMSMFNPPLSVDKVTKLVNDVKMQRKISRQYAEKYLGIAVIGEVSSLTPENIRLNNLKIRVLSTSAVMNKPAKTAKEETAEDITMEGVVFGDRNMLDSYLAQYIMKLSNSPMLSRVSVYKNNIVNFKKSDVLQFTMSAKIGK